MATILITGSNRGIGLELCRIYSTRGDRVIAVCRKSGADLEGLGVRVIAGIDVTSSDDLSRLRSELDESSIDVVVNNAGLLVADDLTTLVGQDIQRQFEVNAMAPLFVAAALVSAIPHGGKIAIVTSRMGSMADNGSGGCYGYRMSKAAVNAVGKSLAVDLASRGIAVVLLHPGYVRTSMTAGRGDVTPDVSARGLVERIDALTLATSGSFVHANGESLPW